MRSGIMRFLCSTIVAGVVAIVPSVAQDNGSISLDTLGIALAQPRAAAQAAMQAAVPDTAMEPDQLVQSIGDGRGNNAEMTYYRSDVIGTIDIQGSRRLEVHYSTDLTGGVVTNIKRSDLYGEDEADAVGFIEALKAKFGEPSYTDTTNYGLPAIALYYVWYEGQLVSMTEQVWREGKYSLEPNPGRCTSLTNQGGYVFLQNRKNDYEGCTTFMKIEIMYGRRDDLMSRMDMYMIDWTTQFEDALLADQHLIDLLNNAISGGTGAAAPAL